MKFPTFSKVLDSFVGVVKRFPLATATSFLATFALIYLNHESFSARVEESVIPVVMACVFIFPLSLAVSIAAEEWRLDGGKSWLLRLVVATFGVLTYFFYFRDYLAWGEIEWFRFVISEAIAVSLLLILPFCYKAKSAAKSFWAYVLSLIGSFAKAFSLFFLLFIGIVLLLLSFDYLFEVRVDEEFYFDAWLVITGLLGVPFFMEGIPTGVRKLNKKAESSAGLLVLTKYFLIPLVFLYVMLLYAYTGRIVFLWDWPSGGVSGWIIAFSAVGIVSYFFAVFLKEKVASYLQNFKKIYFWALIPLIIVLFMAVGMRIADYGFTELRYFGVAFGVWMSLLSLYFIFSKAKDLRFMPMSLAVVLAVSAWSGPFSAFGVSLNSQMDRLEQLLIVNDILIEDKVVALEEEGKSNQKISDIVEYIVSTHGVEPLQPWFEDDLQDLYDGNSIWTVDDEIVALMGLETPYYDYGYDYNHYEYVYFYLDENDDCYNCEIDIEGYENLVLISSLYLDSGDWILDSEGNRLSLSYDRELLLELDFNKILLDIYNDSGELRDIYSSGLVFDFQNEFVEGQLRVHSLAAYLSTDDVDSLSSMSGVLLYNKK